MKIIFLSLFLVPVLLCGESWTWTKEELTFLFSAIEKVESRNGIVGKKDEVGFYQIRKIYVDDVNRIVGKNIYTYDDRLNKKLSEQMMMIYINHYCTKERIGRNPTLEDAARIHNGGPNGFKKISTEEYWKKIERNLK